MSEHAHESPTVLDGEHYARAEWECLSSTAELRKHSAAPLKKVIVYVTRKRAGRDELLVFTHRDHPAAGLQVPAGTMDPGEAAVDAAARELMEESGLSDLPLKGRIDVYEWPNPETSRLHRRHVYHFVAAGDLPDAWDHIVSAGEDDKGLVFQYRWIPLAEAGHALSGDQGRSISRMS